MCLARAVSRFLSLSLFFYLSPPLSLFSQFSFSTLFSSLSFSCHLSLSVLNDNNNIHSFSRLSLSLCPQSLDFPWTLAQSLFGELLASRRTNLSSYSCASLIPLGMKWACTCTGDVIVLVPVLWCACVVLCCVVFMCTAWCGVMVSVVLLLVCGCVLDCHLCVAGRVSVGW